MFAAAAGHADTVKALLGKGADPSLKDATGQTAVALAQRNGREEVVSILRRSGATR
jgi:ankyrin repeat protein